MGILRSAWYRLVLGLVAVLASASPAGAQTPTLDGVQIAGDPVVGSPLTAVLSTPVDAASVKFKWCRAGERAGKCASGGPVGSGSVYVPVAADVGSRLMVTATATIDSFTVEVKSAPTAPVVASRPAPVPTPTPTATPTPPPGETVADPPPTTTTTTTPEPTVPAPTFASPGITPGPAAGPVASPAAPRYLRPFPVIRIRGYVAARGARVTLLKVAAPVGVTVLLRCEGRGCPIARRRSRGPGRIRALERFLPAGIRITIRVVRRGSIGKYTRIRIRAGAPPSRRDACLMPGSIRAVACPPA